jgi:TorA maturation chaperone TorD
MRDAGLSEAIKVAGGVRALARKIGISQPSISNWSRIPAERVLAVEAATGVSRTTLRPDLYGAYGAEPERLADLDDVDKARAQEYALLSRLLSSAPDAPMLGALAHLQGDATPLGEAHAALADAAGIAAADDVDRVFFDLFIGVGRGEILPYGSYYLTGFLHERPLARLRRDLKRLGIERAAGVAEPEDHAGILCGVMSGLAGGEFTAARVSDRTFFEAHLAPWIGRFFADLERADAAEFYRAVGTLGRVFIEIEADAFALSA